MLAQSELATARQEAEVAKEATQATEERAWVAEDAVAAAADSTQDIGLQVSFKVLRQALT